MLMLPLWQAYFLPMPLASGLESAAHHFPRHRDMRRELDRHDPVARIRCCRSVFPWTRLVEAVFRRAGPDGALIQPSGPARDHWFPDVAFRSHLLGALRP